jgi:hypothetical protein
LYYAPGSYAKTEEVIALARVVGEMGGVYESHIRDEADYSVGVVAAVLEVIRIAEEGHLPGIVAHMKALGPASWGLVDGAGRAHRSGARSRGRGLRRSVSVRSERHRHRRRADPAVGRGRRPSGVDQTDRRRGPSRLAADIRRNFERRGGPTSW